MNACIYCPGTGFVTSPRTLLRLPCLGCTVREGGIAEAMMAYSNAADAAAVRWALAETIVPEEGCLGTELKDRLRQEIMANAVAAFMCWASGGCDVVKGGADG